ncbi:uncharacterized protein RAG0_01572 [Rhynchosporium agropyri]|uniref:Uncharacterized protein n=1 Tax=Rhynchosporium agropyri TaxID=914238 RepID=A0A1E1JX74_9HELO|nr:uncharacterized protein RAG0_01572 [Rhynchosporium agropyri]
MCRSADLSKANSCSTGPENVPNCLNVCFGLDWIDNSGRSQEGLFLNKLIGISGRTVRKCEQHICSRLPLGKFHHVAIVDIYARLTSHIRPSMTRRVSFGVGEVVQWNVGSYWESRPSSQDEARSDGCLFIENPFPHVHLRRQTSAVGIMVEVAG